MRCPRCGHRNRGASWYCGSCGAPISDMNVADSVPRRRLPRAIVWSLAISATVLAAVAVMALGLTYFRNRPASVAVDPTPTAEIFARLSASEAAAVAAESTSPSRYPDGFVVPTASIGEATAAADRLLPSPTPGTPDLETVAAPLPGTATPRSIRIPGSAGGLASSREGSELTGIVGAGADVELLLTPRPREGIPSWEAQPLSRRPQIDGALGDWRIDPVEVRAVVFGEEFWEGPDDLGAKAYLGWDQQSLYLGVRVVDDVFSQPGTGAELYLGDSLELQIDTLLEPDRDDDSYSRDDWQIGLSPGDFDVREPEVFVWRPNNVDIVGVEMAAQLLDDGYIVEAAIPWSALEMDPALVGAIGLALNISDNDVEAPAQLTMISSSPERSWSDPRSFGTLILVR